MRVKFSHLGPCRTGCGGRPVPGPREPAASGPIPTGTGMRAGAVSQPSVKGYICLDISLQAVDVGVFGYLGRGKSSLIVLSTCWLE